MTKNLVSVAGGYSNPVTELGRRGFKVVGKTLVRKGKVYHMPRSVERAIQGFKAGTRGYAPAFNFILKEVEPAKPTAVKVPKALRELFSNETRTYRPQTFKGPSGDTWTVHQPRSAGGGSRPTQLPKRDVKVTASQKSLRPNSQRVPYILTDNVVSFYHSGESYQASSANPCFSDLVKALNNGDIKKAVNLVNIANAVEAASLGLIKNNGGVLKHGNEELNETVTDYLVRNMGRNDGVTQAVINFMAKCNKNPSKASVDAMWRFVRKNGLILFPDGDLLCYRYCTDDFKDCHTKTFDNSIGKVCRMPRELVDNNNNIHCSAGLHAQSYHNVMGQSTVIEVKVSPEHVVSIPVGEDWKMRCCEFMSWKLLRHKGVDVAERTKEFVTL